jgi:hypothetical protein
MQELRINRAFPESVAEVEMKKPGQHLANPGF